MFGTFRTILALMVVVLHLGGVPAIGGYAVFAFYILSGYLMTFILHNNYGYTCSGRLRYTANRFFRIYPLYWISAIISAGLIWHLGEDFASRYHPSIYFPKHLPDLFRQVFIFFPLRESPRLTPPAWALTVEIFFYCFIGLGISKTRRTTVIWLTASVLYHVAAVALPLSWEQRYFTIFAASLPFATGALIFHYKCKINSLLIHSAPILRYLPLVLFVAILGNWALGYLTSQFFGAFFYSNFLICACMVAVLSETRELPGIDRRLDKLMGDLSYPMYLFHYQAGLAVVAICSAGGIELKRPSLMLFFASLPMILIFSWIVTMTVERPIDRLRKRIKS